MLTLDVEHANSTDTLRILGPDDLGDAETPSLQSARIERKLTRQPDAADTAEVVVYRDAWSEVEQDLDRTDDRLVVRENGDIIFGGRLADYQRDGVVVSVLIDSPKRDAIDAEPSGANEVLGPQPDSDIVTNDLLTRVPTVDAGTVETVDGAIAFSESHASPGKSLTKLARDADAEVRYRTTESAFELDYVARLGTDRTDETLSPSSATVLGEPRVREQVTEDVTHVRVLGAGEGTAQVEAEAVAPSYSSADDRAVYRQRSDKDIQQSGRAQALAETLVTEYDGAPEYVEIEFEVPRSVDPSLGDSFTVDLPAHDIAETLRIIMLERLIDEAGDRFRAILSNRRHTGDTTGDARALELDSLSEGNAGQIIRDSDSQGFDKLNSGEPQEWFFDYPQNVFGEFEAQLRVESQPFRRPASAQGHSHSYSVPQHNHIVSIDDTSTSGQESARNSVEEERFIIVQNEAGDYNESIFPSASGGFLVVYVQIEREIDRTESNVSAALLRNGSVVDSSGVPAPGTSDGENETVSLVLFDWVDPSDHSYDVSFQLGSNFFSWSAFVNWQVVGKHKHDVSISDTTTTNAGGGISSTTGSEVALQPGIVTEDTLTPSNVSVEIDGTTVVSGLDHPIQETVDISGELAAGANTITTKSDTLGEVRTGITIEAIKNVGENN